MNKKLIQLALATVLIATVSTSTLALDTSFQKLLDRNHVTPDSISVVIRRVRDGKLLVNHNPRTPRNPASAMKLVTTAAALQLLGPTHHWKTEALVDGTVRNNALDGNLILRGNGDPWLVIERLWLLAKRIQNQGITHINGDLVLDNTVFDQSKISNKTIDGKTRRTYNTPPNALLINFGATEINISANNSIVTTRVNPPATTLKIKNNIQLSNDHCNTGGRRITLDLKVESKKTILRLGGSYPRNCGPRSLRYNLLPHDQYVYGVFKSLWQKMGGTLSGEWRYDKTPDGATVIADLDSVPLAEVIRYVNKFSNNVMARNLLLSLNASLNTQPGTPSRGRDAIDRWLHSNSLHLSELQIDNGAGLSRVARISAADLTTLLEGMTSMSWWPEFLGSLPTATVDGSLKNRFHNIAEPGRIRMKTGLLKNVRSLAGYAIDRQGDIWVVAILHNSAQAHQSNGIKVQHQILELLFEDQPTSH
ncbi:MAG: D-alanyl-D-alanine carboxypeptidase/D-alanyl-D-alanine-endopeptidase [Proteobacteria bacterium]|nr:D-alanyl-D-alanine carboxypeptidase/D-alanyl-D-alanine-endopeptidase [Pseudomonadota bacterium]MBT7671367.1 D-alanyl-D-alanine carboxypeptidase/D-alanyl-D-alanine-endopeptidase [Pseudomonadota bacterium]